MTVQIIDDPKSGPRAGSGDSFKAQVPLHEYEKKNSSSVFDSIPPASGDDSHLCYYCAEIVMLRLCTSGMS